MKHYYRLMLGRKSVHAKECFRNNFIGADFGIVQDLSASLPAQWRDFNKAFIPVYLANRPEKTRIGAGLACGALWTVAKGISKGDIVLCPDGEGSYRVGEITGDYFYKPGSILPHRRSVEWLSTTIARSDMSEALQKSTGSISTIGEVTAHNREIEMLLANQQPAAMIIASDPTVEDPAAFAMEKHLEDFLVKNWKQTELGKSFSIYEEDGDFIGQQFPTDAGPIDILAVSKDGRRLLVIELKRGRATDVVVGQTLRYMGYVIEQVAEKNQSVEGVIIALDDDPKLRWALAATPSVKFFRYQISFRLIPG